MQAILPTNTQTIGQRISGCTPLEGELIYALESVLNNRNPATEFAARAVLNRAVRRGK